MSESRPAIPRARAVLAGLVVLCTVGGLVAYLDLQRVHGPALQMVGLPVGPATVPVAPSAGKPVSPTAVLPTFDVVRVSPQGSVVIAGRASAGSEVIVFEGGREIARATADQRGEFVALPSLPLAAGGRELTLVARGGAGGAEVRGEQSVVLVIPDRGKPGAAEAPVVALLDSHGGARLLQQPGMTAEAGGRVEAGAKVGAGAKLEAGRRVSLDVVDYDGTGAVRFSGRAGAGALVRVYVDNVVVGEATADRSGHWGVVPEGAIAAGVHTLRADALDEAGHVLARVELPFQRAVASMLDTERGRVVVQPGQNLWRLARAAYGSGVRYTVIYEANQGQIRDPRLIYPGQAFAVPPGAAARKP